MSRQTFDSLNIFFYRYRSKVSNRPFYLAYKPCECKKNVIWQVYAAFCCRNYRVPRQCTGLFFFFDIELDVRNAVQGDTPRYS